MTIKEKNLEMGIDSSLSYCSITLFKNKKILWDQTKKCDYGHEKILAKILQKLVKDTGIKPDNIKYLHLNKGPARFTAIRNCHALMKGFFFNHKTRIHSYSIFEHYYLGINEEVTKNLLCIIDTNRRDLAIQKISAQGKLIGKSKTYVIGEELFALLNKDYILIGNGLKKLKRISEFKFVKKKSLNLYDLKSNYFINNYFKKKSTYSFPKIIYPYSPV